MAAEDYIDFDACPDEMDDSPRRTRSDNIPSRSCNTCGAPRISLMWKNVGKGWRLHDRATGLRHVCIPSQQPKTKPKESSMDKNIAALMRRDARTVHVVFRTQVGDSWATKRHIYVSHLDLQPGDQVVVPVNDTDHMIAYVKAIDDTVKIEPNSDITYKWVISKIDMSVHEANMQRNADIEAMVADAYRESLRASFSVRVLESMDADKRAAVIKLLE